MYQAADTIYCYPGTEVLRNLADLRTAAEVERFELAMTSQRAEEPLPAGRFSVAHYRAVHRHLFQDVYAWAGKLRRVRIGKGDSIFCYPENIATELRELFARLRTGNFLCDLTADEFAAGAASFLTTLNAIHAFREGNGRTQLTFLAMLAENAGHPFGQRQLRPREFLEAMIRSFHGDESMLCIELRRMIE
jgi:cell filamentation protein